MEADGKALEHLADIGVLRQRRGQMKEVHVLGLKLKTFMWREAMEVTFNNVKEPIDGRCQVILVSMSRRKRTERLADEGVGLCAVVNSGRERRRWRTGRKNHRVGGRACAGEIDLFKR